MSTRKGWEEEYSAQGIPSSFREEPSRAVVWFREQLPPGALRILDLGCGRGRNSLYLASEGYQLDAIDWVEDNIEALQGVYPNLSATCGDLRERFPYDDAAFDAVVDVFCFKHVTDPKDQRHYLAEVARVLKPNGLYFVSLASRNDGFYGPLLADSPEPDRGLVRDPVAQVNSILFTSETLAETLAPHFVIKKIELVESTSSMHGKRYPRAMLWTVARSEPTAGSRGPQSPRQ